MTCVPCKVMMLQVAKVLEALPPQDEPLRSEIRRAKEMLVLTGYYIGHREVDEGRTRYKEES